jgi:hypothetical protein
VRARRCEGEAEEEEDRVDTLPSPNAAEAASSAIMAEGGGPPIAPLDAQSIKELDAQIEQLMKCQVRRRGAARPCARARPPPTLARR